MQGSSWFAYSLCQEADGWRWSVYDLDGVTVAGGANASQAAAQASVDLIMRRAEARLAGLLNFPDRAEQPNRAVS